MNRGLQIQQTSQSGKSIFATKNFKKDEVVFVVAGPIVTTPTTLTVPIDFDLYIDPLSPGKYLNHSCDPTCGIKWRTEIVAMRDLAAGEEVTIDYAMVVPRYKSEMTAENRLCKCGAQNCRGSLGTFEELSDSIRERYRGYISDYLFEK